MVVHTPVMLHESLAALRVREGGCYADLTHGGGGHSRAILEGIGSSGTLFSFDRDEEALKNGPLGTGHVLVHSDFRYLLNWMHFYDAPPLDGVLADLGVSSHHFDTPTRGFSYRFDGPLDMRMNARGGHTAADIVNGSSEEALRNILREGGDVREANRIAATIVRRRNTQGELSTTEDLMACVREALNSPRDDWKLLSKVFQALRIAVNDELGALRALLSDLEKLVAPGGRVVFICYQSYEDKLVKEYFRTGFSQPDRQTLLYGAQDLPFRALPGGSQKPSQAELAENPRARSARLRAGERL